MERKGVSLYICVRCLRVIFENKTRKIYIDLYLSIYLPIYLPIYLSIYLSISVYVSACVWGYRGVLRFLVMLSSHDFRWYIFIGYTTKCKHKCAYVYSVYVGTAGALVSLMMHVKK